MKLVTGAELVTLSTPLVYGEWRDGTFPETVSILYSKDDSTGVEEDFPLFSDDEPSEKEFLSTKSGIVNECATRCISLKYDISKDVLYVVYDIEDILSWKDKLEFVLEMLGVDTH